MAGKNMSLTGHIVSAEHRKDAHKILVLKPEVKR
jgi:hypothetical protein